jgi:integrase
MKRKNKRMRLPNGFGQISKLSGRLRKPYRAMVTVGFTDEGKPICKILRPVGYFETYNDAYMALIENAKSPYEKALDYTLQDVYDKWSEEKYQEVSSLSVRQMKSSWKKISSFGDKRFTDLRALDLENIIRSSNPTPSYINAIISLLHGMYEYALRNEIVSTDYSKLVHVRKDEQYRVEKGHTAFTDQELELLWENSNDDFIKLVLIQTYTGMRPTELLELKPENIYLDANYITGGIKTKAGKNRVIPIHSCIKEYLIEYQRLVKPYIKYFNYRRMFVNKLSKIGLTDHTPHDCRKTFVTLAKKYQVNEYAIKRIVGHSIEDLTEQVYTERDTSWLLDEISKIKCMNTV